MEPTFPGLHFKRSAKFPCLDNLEYLCYDLMVCSVDASTSFPHFLVISLDYDGRYATIASIL